MKKKTKRRLRQLEARVAELEGMLDVRPWDLPPSVHIDMDPSPGIADQLIQEPPFLHPSTEPDSWGYL